MFAKYQTNKRKQNRCCIIYTHTHTNKFRLVLDTRLCVFFIEFPGMVLSTIRTTASSPTPPPQHMEANLLGLRHILAHTLNRHMGEALFKLVFLGLQIKFNFFAVFVFVFVSIVFFFIIISFICALLPMLLWIAVMCFSCNHTPYRASGHWRLFVLWLVCARNEHFLGDFLRTIRKFISNFVVQKRRAYVHIVCCGARSLSHTFSMSAHTPALFQCC